MRARPTIAWRGGLAALLLGCLTLGPGCYLTHAIGGQLSILTGREPIEDVLAAGELPAQELEQLRLVEQVRLFGIAQCGLKESDSYTSFYRTEGDYVAWNVSACEPDAFAPYVWSFPFVGTLPYKGWFRPEPALEEARELAREGLDTLVLPVPAYSTLGWFDDPVFSGLLEDEPSSLAETILHEMTHATVFVSADADWNENLATFVGQEGARRFFLARGGPDDPDLQELGRSQHDQAIITAALRELQQELWRVYESNGPRALKLQLKQALVDRFRVRMATEVRARLLDPTAADGWADPRTPLNNAYLLMIARYHGDQGLFRELLAACDGDLARLVGLLAELQDEDEPRAAARERLRAARPAGTD